MKGFAGAVSAVLILVGVWSAAGFAETESPGPCIAPAGPAGETAEAGQVGFEESTRTMVQYNEGGGWVPFPENPRLCQGPPDCADIGAVCSDGTVFAGCSGNGVLPFFTTRCDAGQKWDGEACGGTRVVLPWNNGNASGYIRANVPDRTDGHPNTAILRATDSDSDKAAVQPHQAARYCADLDLHGHQDWYLPTRAELYLMSRHQQAIGNFAARPFWSSSEYDERFAWFHSFRTEFQDRNPKYDRAAVRCVRRRAPH